MVEVAAAVAKAAVAKAVNEAVAVKAAAAKSAGGCRDNEEMVDNNCLVKCDDGKIRVGELCQDKPMLKYQVMDNDTIHTVTHGTKHFELGTIIHSGILKSILLYAEAKEQGSGNECSSFHLNVMRDGKSIAMINQPLGRSADYKSFFLYPEIMPDTLVQKGDSIRMSINGL